ncbi:MAG TPA: hypothetical protein VLA75_02780, partial [Thermoanaerobaculia bacterium]|nr:hypothetical protein [Thermoanaerobaculia bacterium]
MGIPIPVVRMLMEEGRHRPFGGSVVQLGRSTVFFGWDRLSEAARRERFALRPVPRIELSHLDHLARAGCIDDNTLFSALGFERVESLDLSADESPTHLHDLNEPIPSAWEGRFDLLFDPGTLSSVFDQRMAFRNAAMLVREGGRAIHVVPSSNRVDIALYMYSPQLFADFYGTNGWRIEALCLCVFEPLWIDGRFEPPHWRAFPWTPDLVGRLGFGGAGRLPIDLWVVATRLPGASADRIPQQGATVAASRAAAGAPPPAAEAASPGGPRPPGYRTAKR